LNKENYVNEEKTRVCPVELANSLDNKIRRWLQDPQKILSPYLKEGMKVLDVGCGPGFFSIELAKMVGKGGKVFSVDMQEGMLQIIRNKINGTSLEGIINLIKCEQDEIMVPEKVDFILAFYMVHEVPDTGYGDTLSINDVLFDLFKAGAYLLEFPDDMHLHYRVFGTTLVACS